MEIHHPTQMESSPLSQSTTVTDKLQQDEGKKHSGID
jgi:hypothetical protein